MKGHRRFRNGAWRLSVYVGSEPETGRSRYRYATVHAPDDADGAAMADLGLAALLAEVEAGRRNAPEAAVAERRTRDQIMAAAGRCFSAHGLVATSIEDVADQAGVARQTVYRHFGSRDGLVHAVAMAEFREHARDVAPLFAELPFEQAVEAMILVTAAAVRERPLLQPLFDLDALGITARAAVLSEPFFDYTVSSLTPILAMARERGELRTDVTDGEIVLWLIRVTFLHVLLTGDGGQTEAGDAAMRRSIQLWVVPALRPASPPPDHSLSDIDLLLS